MLIYQISFYLNISVNINNINIKNIIILFDGERGEYSK